MTIGLDLGDRLSHLVALTHDDEVLADETVGTDEGALRARFGAFPGARVVMEAGTHSPWVSRLIAELGHEVIVANPTVLGRKAVRRKNDRNDAMALAREGRADPKKLSPIKHRGAGAQYDLGVIRGRDALVRARTLLINTARSLSKVEGDRIPSASSSAFVKKVRKSASERLLWLLEPLLEMIENLTVKIEECNKRVELLAEKKYPETARLLQVSGVGKLTALTFVLTLEDPGRFTKSRTVGAFLGLVPALKESGKGAPELKISKAGNPYLRRLLVSSAQYTLGHFGEPSNLRSHGESIAARGGKKNAKKRAVTAVARKLAVLLHRLWVTGEVYDPFYGRVVMKDVA